MSPWGPTGLTYGDRLGGSDVDVKVFQRFTQAPYDRYTHADSFALDGLLRGLRLPSLVMPERGGGTITREPDEEAGLMTGVTPPSPRSPVLTGHG
ncbi:DUF6086 family protein [Streptomyces sp. NPDC014656]|uniref:DUF6086 family protein n=1 Tax=Streptomyces sp. NPDC014656 TaxID=3364878 RepID=UPI0036F6C682